MEHIQQPNEERRKSVFHIMDSGGSDGEISHLKSELALMQRKYERLVQKEKRLQVCCIPDLIDSLLNLCSCFS